MWEGERPQNEERFLLALMEVNGGTLCGKLCMPVYGGGVPWVPFKRSLQPSIDRSWSFLGDIFETRRQKVYLFQKLVSNMGWNCFRFCPWVNHFKWSWYYDAPSKVTLILAFRVNMVQISNGILHLRVIESPYIVFNRMALKRQVRSFRYASLGTSMLWNLSPRYAVLGWWLWLLFKGQFASWVQRFGRFYSFYRNFIV